MRTSPDSCPALSSHPNDPPAGGFGEPVHQREPDPFRRASLGPDPADAARIELAQRGIQALRRLLGMALRLRFGIRWYLLALGVPFAVPLTAVAVDALLSGTAPAAWLVAPTAQTLATFWIAAIGEDLGWRGYALSRALGRWRPSTACLVHGTLWAAWHLPMFFMPGTAQSDQVFPVFMLQIIGATMIFTRLFVATGGSVAAMMLMHAAANLAFNTVPVFATEGGNGTRTLLVSLLYLGAGAVALATLPRRTGRAGARASRPGDGPASSSGAARPHPRHGRRPTGGARCDAACDHPSPRTARRRGMTIAATTAATTVTAAETVKAWV